MARSMQHMWPSAMLELHHTLQDGLPPFPALLIAGQVFSNATASGPRMPPIMVATDDEVPINPTRHARMGKLTKQPKGR